MATTTHALGTQFAEALAAKDFERVAALLHPEIDFRAMTPNRVWEADGPAAIVSGVLEQWFEDSDQIEGIDALDTDSFADTERVGYRFSVRNEDGLSLVEQQAYIRERDGRIGWMRVVCSGFRLVAA